MAQLTATTFSTDPALWIFTSLTAGSSHIVTATSRLETILRANRVPFKAVDLATDQKARMLWGRRAGKDASGRVRKLPALVQEGLVLGDITEIEEWNEYGELKQHVKIYYDEFTIPDINNKPKEPIKKKIIKKVPKGTLSGNASTSASTSASAPAPPPAPPLPKDESSTPAAAKVKSVETPQAPTDNSSTVVHRSIADEAAKKAKELRLQSLRDKVHGKTDGKTAEGKKPETDASSVVTTEPDKKAEAATDVSKTPETTRKPFLASTSSGSSAQSVKPVGLQSPTTGSWGAAATNINPDALRETLQSPTTARWKPSDVDKPVTVHMGATVASVSQEEIAAVENAETIKEEPDQENSDEDVDVSQKIAEVEKAQAIKEDPEKEAGEDLTKAAAPETETAPKEAPPAEKTETITKAPQPEEEDDEEDDDDEDEDDDSDEDDTSKPETKQEGAKAKSKSEEKELAEAKIAEPNKPGESKSEGEAKPKGEPEE
ncbi:uncharacterized protein LY79DRAFT_585705 [Colletotrichum navitas]|uniref:Neurofilament protein H form H2 n=1 Tax=Colletotrichum navitas TaxID=681940 RepID=A0AAD8VCG9_9PEZI|nr:uncharacterized protein LY79DRAFT_585705 [Colletotrichum navitas]KAK1600093.1 hypothetical protein LY79DRAFT_585705 [Colletotrichum navitas]